MSRLLRSAALRSLTRVGLVIATTVTLLLDPTTATLAGDRFTDPVGDGPRDGPDILGVTATTTPGDEVRLQVEFAPGWVPDDTTLVVWLFTREMGACPSAYEADYGMAWLGSRPAPVSSLSKAGEESPDRDSVSYDIEGRLLTLTLPLSAIGDPDVLLFAIRVFSDAHIRAGVDALPDDGSCLQVSLAPKSNAPDTALAVPGSSTGGGGSLLVVIGAIALVTAVLWVLGFSTQRTVLPRPNPPQDVAEHS
jgi:hypothetical protein